MVPLLLISPFSHITPLPTAPSEMFIMRVFYSLKILCGPTATCDGDWGAKWHDPSPRWFQLYWRAMRPVSVLGVQLCRHNWKGCMCIFAPCKKGPTLTCHVACRALLTRSKNPHTPFSIVEAGHVDTSWMVYVTWKCTYTGESCAACRNSWDTDNEQLYFRNYWRESCQNLT